MTQRFVTILAILITASMMLGAEANACSNCPGDPRGGGTKNTGNAQSDPDHDRATNRGSYATTNPDPRDPSIQEQTRIPGRFTSREQGGNAAQNDCGCTKGGKSSKGKTGGDMGY